MIRKKKLYVRPKKAYEKIRILEENELMNRYALKNKKEIWRTIAKVNYFRRRAKALARESGEEQQVLFGKLKDLGLKVNNIADVLALNIDDLLQRRLPTVVYKKGFSSTIKQARQMVVHKKILIKNRSINSPGYLVPVAEENLISLRINKPEIKKNAITTEQNAAKIGVVN